MSTLHLRVFARSFTLLALIFALCLSGWGSSLNQGSTIVSRSNNDTFSGGVYIYAGGFFTNGETVTIFNWFDSGIFTGTSAVTPLLFTSDGSGTYTVVGIGAVDDVDSTGPQSAAFGLQDGSNVVTGSNWTFGFLQGAAGTAGQIEDQTAGGIPYNRPLDGGQGVGGAGTTNDWVFTPASDGLIDNVGIGTSFGVNGTFALNSGVSPENNRTYSANADGIISGVAEPGTFSLITGAGLVLAGLFRYRYVRGRRD